MDYVLLTTQSTCFYVLYALCTKPYVGRTVSSLNLRANQHCSAFYKVLKFSNNSELNKSEFDNDSDDIYSLGIHLIKDHNFCNRTDFNKIYRVLILEACSPKNLEVKEHKWIHRRYKSC